MSSFQPANTFPVATYHPFYTNTIKKASYICDSGKIPIAAGADRMFGVIFNTSPTLNMLYWISTTSYNGGTVTGNKVLTFRGRFEIGQAIGNFNEVPLLPTNGYNADPAPGIARFWNGVGAEMTVPAGGDFPGSRGIVAATVQMNKGFLPGPDPYGVIVPPGGSVGCSIEVEEDGFATDLFFFSWVSANGLAAG